MVEVQTLILYGSIFISLFFEIFLLITYLEVREELVYENKLLNEKLIQFPSITIIVPCYNEENTVSATLKSLLNLDYPKDRLSIIIVNDGSTDGTLKVLRKFKNHSQISILSKENGGKHTALNLALKSIKTDLVGCLDADSFVNPDALRKMIPFFTDKTTMAVTPSIKVHNPSNILQYIQKIEYGWGVFLRRMLSSLGALYVTPGPFSIFRTEVFNELGGYRHGHHTEDLEIALRMQKNHYKIVNSQSAHVYTVAPSKLKALIKQRVRWTYGFLNNALDYKEMFFNKRYGHIGIFVLPVATTSIFSSLYIVGNTLWRNLISNIIDALVRFQTVGFNWNIHAFSFNWFFINTGAISILTIGALFLTLVILYLSIKMSEGRVSISRGLFYYLMLYIFLCPLWISKALFNTVFKRQIGWR